MPSHEGYEQLLAYLESQLPKPVDRRDDDGSVRFLAGEPPEVLVTLTEAIVVVAEFAGEWEEPGQFRLSPRRIGVLHWPHLPENELLNALAALIKGARAARRSCYQLCEHCGRDTPPEWMHDEGVCQKCAVDLGGAIH
jgi:hypothetical protein